MWYIKNLQGEIIYLKPNRSMTVSRKDQNDIVLKDDASISKLHASITVRPKVNFKHNEPSSTVFVKDVGSKYGTFIIDVNKQQRKLTSGDHELTATDKVKFGLQNSIFTLHYVPLIISTSRLDAKEKTHLRNIVDILDGVIIDKWEEYCTHLTVSNVTLTTQVVQALSFGTPIVRLEYWDTAITSIENNEELPDISDFIPTINEGLIDRESVSLKANTLRRILFKNMIFICFAESQLSLKNIVKYAGGRFKLFREGLCELEELCSDDFVLLQLPADTLQPSQAPVTLYDSIQKSLQRKRLRLIPDSEISLAILYCSIEKYCNPKFDFKRLISSSNRNINPVLSSTVLAADTEEVVSTLRNIPAVIINETLTSSEQQDSRSVKKRKLSLGRREAERKGNFGSEESSREDALMIDETISSFESDSNDADTKKQSAAKRRFNLTSKSRTSTVPKKDLVKSETRGERYNEDLDDNFFSNPSTSKDTSSQKSRYFEFAQDSSEGEETRPAKRTNNVSDQKPTEKSLQRNIIPNERTDVAKVGKPSNSAGVKDRSKLPKLNRMDEGDMFSFVSEETLKRKRNARGNAGDNLFELLEDPDTKNFYQEDNIFERELKKIKKPPNKKKRTSLSSDDASSDEEQPKIKIEKPDTDDEIDNAPLIRCKKELDSSMDEKCKSSIVSLLRKDIDYSLDITLTDSKSFVKMYTSIPKQRIKLKNMHVWKIEDDTIKCESQVESESSEDEEGDLLFKRDVIPKTTRGRKWV